MEINKLLLEGYLIFGIILTYAVAVLIGILIGEKQSEEKEYKKNVKKLQSNKKKFKYDTELKIMEQRNKT